MQETIEEFLRFLVQDKKFLDQKLV